MIKMHTLPVYDHACSFRWNKKDYWLEEGELRRYEPLTKQDKRHKEDK